EESFIYPFGTERRRGNGFRTPELDLYETDDDVVVEASVPGLEPEDIDISVAGNTLSLKGEMKHEEEKEEKGTYYFRERRYGSFQRTLTLPS
ncbi:MAG: Hsp20 family protein, partial [Anaerolineae bacterium]|nr:Hsp20 family protein [Anaerolineae bacterium]